MQLASPLTGRDAMVQYIVAARIDGAARLRSSMLGGGGGRGTMLELNTGLWVLRYYSRPEVSSALVLASVLSAGSDEFDEGPKNMTMSSAPDTSPRTSVAW